MKCIKCGKEMAEATRFCPECGTASVSQSAQPVSSSQLGTATGTRDQYTKTKMVYPRNPPLSPHLAWLTLICTGLPQFIHGQYAKGLIWCGLAVVSWFLLPLIGVLILDAVAIIDAYMVGKTLMSGKPVGKMQFFPSA